MAPLTSSTRELFSEAVRAVLETWPVLQIAVDNGFGGAFSQQKAEWMVGAIQQHFMDNDDLQQDEVEDFISELMNNEFDTVVDDGSLTQVAQKVCEMFQQCQQDRLKEVREQINQMIQKKSAGRAKVTPAADDDDDESEDEEAMECDGPSVNGAAVQEQHLPPQATSREEVDDGWTVVRKKK
ncbi:hypothetical protein Q8A67_009675 [Cirrhinus molitorella]|uniref:Pre-rRNA-processing protein TSR2 homolog n=1 Tax=Cirrhinus molitorella TaxID=172907 RepID=A0AA88PZX5_9TELE|nr:hypothetical protein Q8A67_009675 [Cirrhinus molitorella]